MIRSTIVRFSLNAASPAFSNRLKSASTVLWSSLSSVMASMRRATTRAGCPANSFKRFAGWIKLAPTAAGRRLMFAGAEVIIEDSPTPSVP